MNPHHPTAIAQAFRRGEVDQVRRGPQQRGEVGALPALRRPARSLRHPRGGILPRFVTPESDFGRTGACTTTASPGTKPTRTTTTPRSGASWDPTRSRLGLGRVGGRSHQRRGDRHAADPADEPPNTGQVTTLPDGASPNAWGSPTPTACMPVTGWRCPRSWASTCADPRLPGVDRRRRAERQPHHRARGHAGDQMVSRLPYQACGHDRRALGGHRPLAPQFVARVTSARHPTGLLAWTAGQAYKSDPHSIWRRLRDEAPSITTRSSTSTP